MVKCFKLVNGDEFMATVVNETPAFFELKNLLTLVMVAEGQLALMPYLPLAEQNKLNVDRDKVVLSYIPKTDLVNHYREQTGGIVTAGAGTLKALPPIPPNFGR